MAILRVAPTRAQQALSLLRAVNAGSSTCPCHSHSPGAHAHGHGPAAQPAFLNPFAGSRPRALATPVDPSRQKEYAFEVAASSVRFGPGCTKEVGMDVKNMEAQRVMVVTDQNVAKLDAMKQVIEGLEREGVQYDVYDQVRVEPKDSS